MFTTKLNMPRKRTRDDGDAAAAEPVAKRRSARQAAAASTKRTDEKVTVEEAKKDELTPAKKCAANGKGTKAEEKTESKTTTTTEKNKGDKSKNKPTPKSKAKATDNETQETKASKKDNNDNTDSRAVSEDPDVDSIPTINPDAPRHEGEWYWLMKAEPETRLENGIDVRFSIDDLRAKDKPEGWDGEVSPFDLLNANSRNGVLLMRLSEDRNKGVRGKKSYAQHERRR